MMRVVVAPDSFKGVLDSRRIAECIGEGIRRARPQATVTLVPMADGGEGTLDVLVDALHGHRRRVAAHGPLGEPLDAAVGLVRDASTAVVELARTSGYALVPAERRDPLRTTTYGLGEVLRACLDAEVEDIILCAGGSATVDGGAGMMQALGLTLVDAAGETLPDGIGGGRLRDIERFVWHSPPDGLENARITIAVDVLNPACGPNGAAAVFGPQKGADAAGVWLLEEGMAHWAGLLERECGRRIRDDVGMGAAGGVALPLTALTQAIVVPGVDLVGEAVGLTGHIAEADLVITGEGRLDQQSMMGKVVGAVGRMAASGDVPCVAIVGARGEGAEECREVLEDFWTLDAPLDQTAARLREVAEIVARRLL